MKVTGEGGTFPESRNVPGLFIGALKLNLILIYNNNNPIMMAGLRAPVVVVEVEVEAPHPWFICQNI